jgi:uncharacterized protein (DUF697 family)
MDGLAVPVKYNKGMFERLRRWWAKTDDATLQKQLAQVRQRTPSPVFWLFGKTQTGKTSLVRFLTGAEDAEIGQGFRPCTRFSREYLFPDPDAPLITFLDTRGTDEPDYDPAEDLERFDKQAHVVVVTVRLLDQAQERTLAHLERIRRSEPSRPIVLVLTCLHEAYPQRQHPQPYPFTIPPKSREWNVDASEQEPAFADAIRSINRQLERFGALADRAVAVDLTPPAEGFAEPNYGGNLLRAALLEALPAAYRQTVLRFDEAQHALKDWFARKALPHIIGYSTLAATAGAVPVPWIDLLILPGIQSQMISHLARLYGQPLSATRFLELASTLGLGIAVRQAAREVIKFVPYVGSVAGGALAGASTFALGKAFCFYYSAVHQGHVPRPEDLRRYYQDQLALAEKSWNLLRA